MSTEAITMAIIAPNGDTHINTAMMSSTISHVGGAL